MKQQWLAHLPLDNIESISPVGGGDVNEAFQVKTPEDTYFLLVQRNRDKSFFEAEIAGLDLFEAYHINAPRVIDSGEIHDDAYLLLTFLQEGTTGSQRELGQLVAKVHSQQQQNQKFGFDLPYEGGNISFDNSWTNEWVTLFVEYRLDHLKDELHGQGLWTDEDVKRYNQVRTIIVDKLEQHNSKSSLLHGDLWAGNVMFLEDGTPALFDPAPLYGDREFDIGITTVFGGFTQAFYEAYNQHYPLAHGAPARIEFYRLYLLMVHLLKFGSMYDQSVNRSMEKILTEAY